MPAPGFFRNFGLFVQENFYDPETCARIQGEMSAGESQKALITGTSELGTLDETTRRALSVRMEKSTKVMVSDSIIALKPSLEKHFQVSLEESEKPAFLRYGEGCYYKPHLDDYSDAPRRRRVSIVIFLNGSSNQPAEHSYGGGCLAFYGLLDGPQWEKCPFPLKAEPGLLIAFRSEVLHEVQPVTFGQRFTIVSWFRS